MGGQAARSQLNRPPPVSNLRVQNVIKCDLGDLETVRYAVCMPLAVVTDYPKMIRSVWRSAAIERLLIGEYSHPKDPFDGVANTFKSKVF